MDRSTRLIELPHEQLIAGQYQMRRQFDAQALEELAQSIKSTGLLQPIVVRALSADQYEIVAGERRWRACKLAGLQTVSCLLNDYTDEQVAAASAIENVNRVNLNPIEEAVAYKRLVDDFFYRHEEVASIVGKSRAKITNSLRLLKLAERVQTLLIDGVLSEGHGKLLSSLDIAEQCFFAEQCRQQAWSVRNLEKEIAAGGHANIKVKKTLANEDANLKRLAERLSLHVGCPVTILHNEKQTRLQIDCHNLDVLDGVLDKINFKEKEF